MKDPITTGSLPETPASFLILMQDYQDSYSKRMESDRRLRTLPFESCARELFADGIFYGDAFVAALQAEGHAAWQTVPLCLPLQYKWAAENGVWVPPSIASQRPFRWYWNRRFNTTPTRWALWRILEQQIQRSCPQFTWFFSGVPVSHEQLVQWRPHTGRLLLWWSVALSAEFPYEDFDLILTGVPARVTELKKRNLKAAYLPQAFDPRFLQQIRPEQERIPRVAFVGNLETVHRERARFLDALSRHVELDFFGEGIEMLPADSPLRARARGSVWGTDLYSIYGSYLLVVHKEAEHAAGTSTAKRLYEATGMGACLVTERTDDLENCFEPEHEVVTYSSLDECVEKIKELLRNPRQAVQIGQRGQARTLRDHTYKQRMQQLLAILRQERFL